MLSLPSVDERVSMPYLRTIIEAIEKPLDSPFGQHTYFTCCPVYVRSSKRFLRLRHPFWLQQSLLSSFAALIHLFHTFTPLPNIYCVAPSVIY